MLKRFWAGITRSAGADLPSEPLPTIKGKRQALPSYLTSAKQAQTPIPLTDRRLATTDPVVSYRNGASTSQVLRDFAASSPELSAAIFAYLRIAISNKFVAVCKNPDGTFNPDATRALQQVISRIDVLPDYTEGFNGVASLRSLSESLGKELLLEGAMCAELVLNKARLPSRIQPISVSGLKLQPDKDGYLVPVQSVGGVNTVLDSPAIFYVSLDQDLKNAYAASPLEPALKAVVFSEQFIADLQRVVKRVVNPRMQFTINEELFRKNAPGDATGDPKRMAEYMNEVIRQIQNMVNDLKPEDALVLFDSIEFELANNGNASLSQEWDFIKTIVESKLASGAKTMPAVLGMSPGSQNVASTESMLFVKSATGAITGKLNEFYSRVFTLAIRLLGFDVVCDFRYEPVDLRPESELESFKAVKQSRVLELLSLGLITDEEAALELTGKLPPPGMTALSGTKFMSNAAPNGADTNNGDSALNKDLSNTSAKGVKSQNTKSSPTKKQGATNG